MSDISKIDKVTKELFHLGKITFLEALAIVLAVNDSKPLDGTQVEKARQDLIAKMED